MTFTVAAAHAYSTLALPRSGPLTGSASAVPRLSGGSSETTPVRLLDRQQVARARAGRAAGQPLQSAAHGR